MTIKRGDTFVAYPDERPAKRLFITVNRVAKDGAWAGIACQTWAVYWTKRQRLPLMYTEPCVFTMADLEAQEADHMAMLHESWATAVEP